MNCSAIRPNLEAYALGALDPHTRAHVETHLQTCPACRRALYEWRTVVAELPRAVGSASPLRPPPSIKQQLLQAAQADARADSGLTRPADAALAARRGQWRLNPRVWFAALAVSFGVILTLLVWTFVSDARMKQALAAEQAARQQIQALREQQELAVPVLNSFSTRELVLSPTALAPDAYGKVLLEPDKPTIVVFAHNLPKLPASSRYVLWTINKGVIQSVREFTPNDSGFAMVVFMAERQDPILKEIFVTEQPATEILPTSRRILVWKADPNDSSDELSFGMLFPRAVARSPER